MQANLQICVKQPPCAGKNWVSSSWQSRARRATDFAEVLIINEGTSTSEVYADNLSLQITSAQQVAIVQESHYLPFGLAAVGLDWNADGHKESKFTYNGKEKVTDFNLGWHDFHARQYDPQCGCFRSVDPLAEKYYSSSPYNYVDNNPISRIDPDGKDWVDSKGNVVYDTKANDGKGAYTEYATNNHKRLGAALLSTKVGSEQFNKLVNSDHPIETKLNLKSDIVYGNSNQSLITADATMDTEETIDFATKKSEITVTKSVITLNVATIEEIIKPGNKGRFSGISVEGISIDDMLGAVLGHEIEHTTKENAALERQGKDPEEPAHNKSRAILQEVTEKTKEKK